MKNLIPKIALTLILIIVLFFIFGCGTKNLITNAKKNGVNLSYSFSSEFVEYDINQEIDQMIDAFGQEINVNVLNTANISIAKNSDVINGVKLNMKINNIDFKIDANGQKMDVDLSQFKDKEFHMTVNSLGKEVDTHEADEIVFQISPDEKSNFGMIFNSFFPDLPEELVCKGHSWTGNDTLSFKDGDRFTLITMKSVYTLNDFVELDGFNCAEISSEIVGVMEGNGFSQGIELKIEGKISGKGLWYFDFENGVLVKDNVMGESEGIIKMPEADLPLKRNFNNTTILVK